MMHPPPWQLKIPLAELHIEQIGATVDLSCPGGGLRSWHGLGEKLAGIGILGIEMPSFSAGNAGTVGEYRVRGRDLVAAYQGSPAWPVRVDALWHALEVRAEARDLQGPVGVLAALELIVSVWTELPDTLPETTVRSVLPQGDVLRLADRDSGRFVPWEAASDPPGAAAASEGPGCFLFRPPGGQVSYAEMVHPVDFRKTLFYPDSAGQPLLAARHHLFVERLEKGVLLRARVRGLFLARAGDGATAAAWFRAFSTTEPPLGT